jgi:hypothetical protein
VSKLLKGQIAARNKINQDNNLEPQNPNCYELTQDNIMLEQNLQFKLTWKEYGNSTHINVVTDIFK